MSQFPAAMQALITEFSKLPSIGEKTAARLAYFIINNERDLARRLSEALSRATEQVRLCAKCYHLADSEFCTICSNTSRDSNMMCVVEKPMDVIAIERMGEFRGVYHVLHGLWAPLRGKGSEHMKLGELVTRLKEGSVKEVILATSATVEGDATALYIARLLNELGVKSSRLAQGIPKGGELEYADDLTLARALSGRSQIVL